MPEAIGKSTIAVQILYLSLADNYLSTSDNYLSTSDNYLQRSDKVCTALYRFLRQTFVTLQTT